MVAAAEVVPTTQNTGLSRIDSSEKIMSLCKDGEASLKFITDMGKTLANSRMLKLKNPEQGAAVVFASICEGTTPFQMMREFHIMDDGGMSMKSDVMLAKFNAAGGKHQWVKTGDDGAEAILLLIFGGQDIQVSYSIDDAKRAGLVRAKSNWEKDPGSMLRARATSKGVRMVMPGIVAGIYCPEDFDSGEIPAAEPAKARTTKAAKTAVAADDPNVADAAFEPVTTATSTTSAASESAPFDGGSSAMASSGPTAADSEHTTMLMEVDLLLTEIGKTRADIELNMQKKSPDARIDTLSVDRLGNLLTTLRNAAEKKRAVEAA